MVNQALSCSPFHSGQGTSLPPLSPQSSQNHAHFLCIFQISEVGGVCSELGVSLHFKEEELAKWPYLDGVDVPCIQADVELLIGTNASKKLEPWEVVNSHGNGPYTIRTLLGWVINGTLQGYSDKWCESVHPNATVNRISIERLEKLLNNQYNHDFNEYTSGDKEEMSRDDVKFMKIMKNSVKLQDGHYSLKLPFKIQEVPLPNNHCVARQRIIGLKRRFERNEKFHQEYTNFLSEVINEGYADRVPERELKRSDGAEPNSE